jgi:hypothetical protein
MMTEKVVWAIAMEFISTHGSNAERVASLCLGQAERSREQGKALTWHSVLLAIEELLRAKPDNGEWTN